MPFLHRRENAKRIVVLLGIAVFLSLVLWLLQQGYELGSLPGDVFVAVADYNLYFPTTTVVLISLIFNLAAYLVYSLVRHRLHMRFDHVPWER